MRIDAAWCIVGFFFFFFKGTNLPVHRKDFMIEAAFKMADSLISVLTADRDAPVKEEFFTLIDQYVAVI